MRILVTHHPLFALPVGDTGETKEAAGRSDMALDAAADAGVDMLLAGHHHVQSAHSARDLATRAGAALVIQAGTATSVRLREGTQSFNRVDIDGDTVNLTVQRWVEGEFVSDTAQRFERKDENWKLVGAEKDIAQPAH